MSILYIIYKWKVAFGKKVNGIFYIETPFMIFDEVWKAHNLFIISQSV